MVDLCTGDTWLNKKIIIQKKLKRKEIFVRILDHPWPFKPLPQSRCGYHLFDWG